MTRKGQLHERITTKLMVLLLTLLMVGVNVCNAQRGYSSSASKFVLAVEGGISNRTFTIDSDISAYDKMKFIGEGWSAGLMAGGKTLRGRIIFGNYKPSSTVSVSASQTTYTGQLNFYPLSLTYAKVKYFKPYFLTGLDINRVKFFGTFVQESEALKAAAAKPVCCCASGGSGMPADPDQPSGDPDVSKPNLKPSEDILTATQGMVGMGMEVGFQKSGRMFSMFSEARYGFLMGTNTLSTGLLNTSISGQWSLYFGVTFGLTN